MWDGAVDLAVTLERLLGDLAGTLTGAAPGWLVAGVLLHLGNQVARGRGWFAIVRTACDGDPALRRRDAILAWMAGAGASGLASARGGDAVRIFLLARRLPRAGCGVLAGTIVAEGAGELAGGLALLALALAVGVGPDLGASAAAATWVAAALFAVVALALLVRRVPALRRLACLVGHGCASLRHPATYARTVMPWQLVSRACRLAALACFLAAFHLPATPAAVLLVIFAQGSGRLLPLAPASVGAGAALLAATFEPVTGTAVPAAQVAAFFVGTSTVLTVVGLVLAAVICAGSQASAKAGRKAFAEALRGRATEPRAATAPAR